MADYSKATRENVVRRAIGCDGWFTADVCFAVAEPAKVKLVLNDLVREGQLEKRRNGRGGRGGGLGVEYRWKQD